MLYCCCDIGFKEITGKSIFNLNDVIIALNFFCSSALNAQQHLSVPQSGDILMSSEEDEEGQADLSFFKKLSTKEKKKLLK